MCGVIMDWLCELIGNSFLEIVLVDINMFWFDIKIIFLSVVVESLCFVFVNERDDGGFFFCIVGKFWGFDYYVLLL